MWTAGERQPVAKLPEGVKYVPGEDNAFAGRADYYQLRYGPYLIAMNSSRDRQFSLALPKRKAAARELVSGAVVPASASAIPVGPGETVVVALE